MTTHFVPRGIAHLRLNEDVEPVHTSFLLLPNLSMLAFSSAIEPLRIANQLTGKVLFKWETLSTDGSPVVCSNGVELGVDRILGETERGSLIFVCAGVEPEKAVTQSVADWLRQQWRSGRSVGGLCTGAYALARAGILNGKRFTLHWENFVPFREAFPNLVPLEQLYVIDDRIITCGGGAAATDLFVKLIYERFGSALSQLVLNMCLRHSHRSGETKQRSSRSSSLGFRNENVLKILTQLDKGIDDYVSISEIMANATVSRRQVERLFKRHLGLSPRRYLTEMRLQNARALLVGTDLTVIEVSAACGFPTASNFTKHFRTKFGVSPQNFSIGRC